MIRATKAFQSKEYDTSLLILESIVEQNPEYVPAYLKLGYMFMHTSTPKKALPYLNKALELAPEEAQNWTVLGSYYQKLKIWTEAIRAYQKSLELSGDNAMILYELFKIYRELSAQSGALQTIEKLLLIAPDNSTYRWEYAKFLRETEREVEALTAYNQLVNSKASNIPIKAIEEWCSLMIKYRFVKEARISLKSLSEGNPDNIRLKELYGQACEADMDDKSALKIYQDVYKQTPENIRIVYMTGVLLYRLGNLENAKKFLINVLDKDPLFTPALQAISSMHQYKANDDLFQKLNFAKNHLADLSLESKTELHYALGKAYDDINDLEAAFEHYKEGGRLHDQGMGEREYTALQRQVFHAKSFLTKEFFENNMEDGCTSKKPIFIVGMPRSGTTLIEQVLSSMGGMYGAGEVEYIPDALNQMDMGAFALDFGKRKSYFSREEKPSYLDRGSVYIKLIESLANKEAAFIIDKTPINFVWLGYIHLILPHSVIIHSRRHPVETCLSVYRIFFSDSLYWSSDLRMVGKFYRLYTELMTHWKSVLPEGTILDVRYEDMVSDLETESKRMAEHIGISWDASCLKFHESKRAVRTASLSQVRQPIYKTSMNRWRKYEPYLKPLLDEISDLVEAYERELTIKHQ